jgi:hypothetical protein
MTPQDRGALAGAVAAALWTAADPLFKRAFDTPYSDSEVLSAFVTRGRLQPLVGLVLHSANGAAFGWLFARLGGRGVKSGVAAALVENTLLWPVMPLVDRVHPNRRDGTWPPLARNSRVFAQATGAHALFGAVLGLLGPRTLHRRA